jgi:hypothetical protein
MKYVQPYGVSDEQAPYINGNPTIGQEGSIPPAGAFEYPMREIENFITDCGLVPSNGDLHQISRGVQIGKVQTGIDTGTKNAGVVALNPHPDALVIGMEVRFKKIAQGNDAAYTLDVGLGQNAVKRANGAALGVGDMPASTMAVVIWDGAQWQLMNFQATTSSGITNNFVNVNLPYAVDTGTPNTVIAAFSPAVTALAAGDMFKVKLANAITGAATIKCNALSAVALVRPDGSPCQGGEGAVGQVGIMIFDGTAMQFASASVSGTAAAGLATSSINLMGTAPGGTKTAAWTVDELVTKSALGGTSYGGANLSLNFNGATVGVNGMDVGTTPSTADLMVYAIYNPTSGVWATFGTIAYRGPLYGGTLPSGFKGSGLIWAGKTDVNGNIIKFVQYQRHIDMPYTQIFSNAGGSASWVAQTVAVAVPYCAKSCDGWMAAGSYGGLLAPSVGSSSDGVGMQMGPGSAGFIGNYQPTISFEDVLLITPQVIYWTTFGGGLPNTNMSLTGYSI